MTSMLDVLRARARELLQADASAFIGWLPLPDAWTVTPP